MPYRYLSPALQTEDTLSLHIAPLMGVEARIYNDLWKAVVEAKLPPGAKLEEAAMCEIYGVSRTVIRKVLVIMEREGLVSLPVNRGAYIAQPTPRDAEELLEALAMFGVYFAKTLASDPDRLGPESRERLAQHLDADRKATAAHDFHGVRRLRFEFGTLLGMLVGNRILTAAHQRAVMRLALVLASYQKTPTPGGEVYIETATALILGGRVEEVGAYISEVVETIGKTLRFDTDGVDLRSILGG